MTRPGLEYDAIVLAGGRGSRLGGVDKAAVELGGRPLVDAAWRATSDARQLVVVGETAAPLPARARSTREDPPGGGPAAAVLAGLAALEDPAPWVLVVACDLPGAVDAVARLRRDVEAGSGAGGTILVDPDGHPQWTLGLYSSAQVHARARELGSGTGHSLRALFAGLDLSRVVADAMEWQDVDTWDDHEWWQRHLVAHRPESQDDGGHEHTT